MEKILRNVPPPKGSFPNLFSFYFRLYVPRFNNKHIWYTKETLKTNAFSRAVYFYFFILGLPILLEPFQFLLLLLVRNRSNPFYSQTRVPLKHPPHYLQSARSESQITYTNRCHSASSLQSLGVICYCF